MKQTRQISTEEWRFAKEFADTFKLFLENAGEVIQPKDGFDEYLFLWGFALGGLTHNAYTGVLSLLETGNLRSATILSRSLLEYDTRLQYYWQDGEPKAKAFRNSKKRNKKNALKQLFAVRDMNNAWPKMLEPLKIRPLDLDSLSDKERKAFLKRVEKQEDTFNQNMRHMLSTVWKGKPHAFGAHYSAYMIKSSYSHGDQAIVPEVLDMKDDGFVRLALTSAKMSAFHILGESLLPAVNTLGTLTTMFDYNYGLYWAVKRFRRLFVEPDPTEYHTVAPAKV